MSSLLFDSEPKDRKHTNIRGARFGLRARGRYTRILASIGECQLKASQKPDSRSANQAMLLLLLGLRSGFDKPSTPSGHLGRFVTLPSPSSKKSEREVKFYAFAVCNTDYY